MCTLTVVPRPDENSKVLGYRLVFNRDEQLTRSTGTDPTIEEHGGIRAILPRDPDSGGTWIAVTEFGLAFAVLNVNPSEEGSGDSSKGKSRGLLIPPLLECVSVDSVARALPAVASEVIKPFRLVVTDGLELLDALGQNGCVKSEIINLDKSIMKTSSGLGDDVVEPPRRKQFEFMFGDADANLEEAQEAFHSFRFPDQDEISVDMKRLDACTVSSTVIDVTEHRIQMIHRKSAPRKNAPLVTLSLDRRGPLVQVTGREGK